MDYVANILKAFDSASNDDIAHGAGWYDGARALAESLDPANVRRGAGVIAALSPMLSWPQNLLRAKEVFETGTTRGLSRNVAKAVRIYNGEDPIDVLSGEKVRSFFHNIMGDDEGVTIDRHAIDIAYGRVMSDKERAEAVKRTKARDGYAILRQAYLDAAAILSGPEYGYDLSGAQLQAIVWVYWRRNVIANFHGDA